jgi:uncharacterized protein YjbI with pentapeptide repeats
MDAKEIIKRQAAGEKKFKQIDLQRGDFSGVNFNGNLFDCTSFFRSYMPFSNFKGAQLNWVVFELANLVESDFEDADLSNAMMMEADLFHANLKGANLRGANLEGAILDDASFCEAIMPDGTKHP